MSSEVPAQRDSGPVNAEEWRPWVRNPRYQVSSHARVRGVRGGILRQQIGTHGYWQLSDIREADGKRGTHPVHRMVCETFHGPRPPGKEVAHDDGDRRNARADNLFWKTPSENNHDTIRHGRLGGSVLWRGEDSHKAVLTEEQVREIRRRHAAGGCSYSSLSREYGTHVNTIRQVVLRETWKHVA